MKLIHTFDPPESLKVYTLDGSDIEEFKKFRLSNEAINRLRLYMDEKGLEVKISECYDGQSGWRGKEFWLNGKDLSGNGYCFSEGKLISYLDSIGY